MSWIDISQPFTKDVGHWPGDVPFSYELSLTKEQTGSVNIGKITTSLHTGTHVDAPFHFDNDGETIDKLPLDSFIGKALVIDVSETNFITSNDFEHISFGSFDQILLKTSLPNQPKRFPKEVPLLDHNIAPFLKEKEIKLIGVDIPSVDKLTSKQLETHHALHKQGIMILENIMLDDVDPGLYKLIALPLRIVGADGSPVRAVIRKIKEDESNE